MHFHVLFLACSFVKILYTADEGDSHWIFFLQAGDSTAEELASATQVQGCYMPVVREKPTVELVKVTDEMKSFNAYAKLRVERANKRHFGARLKKAAEAEKEDKK